MIDAAAWDRLRPRLGDAGLLRRIQLEERHETRIARRRVRFLYRDIWYAHPAMIRTLLQILGLYARGRRNAEQVLVKQNRVALPTLPHAFGRFTILHLSDLHAEGNAAAMRRVASLIKGLPYDICVMTGDYRSRTYGTCEGSVEGLLALRRHIRPPVYAVLGNHDPIALVEALEKMGVKVLLNECEEIRRGADRIFLAGIDDTHFFGTGDIAKAAAPIPNGACAILLSHTPEIFRGAERAGFNLLLSGHTHGGQICLPGQIPLALDARLPRRFAAGPWRYGAMHGYTSVGAGTSIVPVRFNCPPEITLHELVRE